MRIWDELGPSYTVGGNKKWLSHFGKQFGSFLNVKHSYQMTQQPHSQVYSEEYWKLVPENFSMSTQKLTHVCS